MNCASDAQAPHAAAGANGLSVASLVQSLDEVDADVRDHPTGPSALGQTKIGERAGVANIDPIDVFAGPFAQEISQRLHLTGRQRHRTAATFAEPAKISRSERRRRSTTRSDREAMLARYTNLAGVALTHALSSAFRG